MSSHKKLGRRDFLKLAGLTGIALPAIQVLGNAGGYEFLSSREAYGGFVVRTATQENPLYKVDDSVYARFSERNNMFKRLGWDPKARIQIAKRMIASGMSGDAMGGPPQGAPPGMSPDGGSPDPKKIPKMNRMIPHKHIKNKTPGKTRLDYAVTGAAWTVATTLGSLCEVGGASDPEERGLYSWSNLGGFADEFYGLHDEELGRLDPADYDPQELTDTVKAIAKFFGASLVGVAQIDERWIYADSYVGTEVDPPIIFEDIEAPTIRKDQTKIFPRSMKYVIAMAFEMDYEGLQLHGAGPSAATVGLGYSRMAFTAGSMAEFFRALGYNAIPSGNSTALSPAIAVDAGLGEMGRNGVVITPKYGPRVRLAKVFTDLPLVPDKPISFGVTEFCESCMRCADECPSGAIPTGPRTWEGVDISNNSGVYKWYVNGLNCMGYWIEEGMDCAQCINVCPFNKPDSWLHDITRTMIGARSGMIDRAMVSLDKASGYGEHKDASDFWVKKNDFMHIK